MKKKIVIICVVLVLVVVGVYFGYKKSLLDRYSISHVDEKLTYKDEWIIKYKSKDVKEYLSIEDFKIENVFKDFDKTTTDDRFPLGYEKKLEDGSKVAVNFFEYVSYVEELTHDISVISGDIDEDMIHDFMEKHDFKDDLEFIKYLNNYEEKKINVFTSAKEIKENYVVEFLRDLVLVDADFHTIKFLMKEGSDMELSGYVYEAEKFTEVDIIKDDKKYTLVTKSGYFSEEELKDLLSTVEIN